MRWKHDSKSIKNKSHEVSVVCIFGQTPCKDYLAIISIDGEELQGFVGKWVS